LAFVEEDLVAALLGPGFVAGVAGVLQDGLDGGLGSGATGGGAVAVAFEVVRRRGEDALFGEVEVAGEAGVVGSGDEFLEDSFDDWCGDGVGSEPVKALAVVGFSGLRRSGAGTTATEPKKQPIKVPGRALSL